MCFTMERLFLTCFPPLRRGKPSSSMDIDESARLFSSLVSDVDRLRASLPEGSISLKWCSEAANLLTKMHFQWVLFYEKSKIPSSWDGIDILDAYMKETVDLLDLCNSLKSAISGMERYRLMVDVAVTKLCDEENPNATIGTEIESLKRERKKINGDMKLSRTGMPETKTKDKAIRFIYVIKSTINVMGMLLSSAVLHPTSIEMNQEVFLEFPQLKLFSAALGKLVDCFVKELQGVEDKRPVLLEHRVMEKELLDIEEEVFKAEAADQEKLLKSIDLLKKSSLALKEGMEIFGPVVNELFVEVVRGRTKLLAMVKAIQR